MGFETGPIDHREKWKAAKPEAVIEVVGSLPEALANNNPDKIKELLKDPGIWRGAILNREKNNQNLLVLRDGFDRMFAEEFGKMDDLYAVDSKKVLDWIRKLGWPENILNEMIDESYHLRDEMRFFRLLNIVLNNDGEFKDASVVIRAMHSLATWQSMVEGNPGAAIEGNKKVLGQAREIGDQVLETKAGFGLTYNKSLKPKDKAIAFEKYRAMFEANGDDVEAARAMAEAADAYANLAKGQWGNSAALKFDNLDKAEFLANEALQKSHELGGYTNAIIRAHKVLYKVYTEQGELVKAEKHRNEADLMEKIAGINKNSLK